MPKRTLLLILCVLLLGAWISRAQQSASLPSAPLPLLSLRAQAMPQAGATATTDGEETLTRQQAEQLALRNNPRISVAALIALAQRQVVRETRSAELPSLIGTATGVVAEQASRIGSGELAASQLLNHVGAGAQLSQLITDFGRTPNLVASSSLQAESAQQDSLATQEDIVLATDLAFYSALEAQATLQVAISTVNERKSVSDQVSALTASKLKSTLDQSFAQVNLSQARLLVLDSQNQADAAMAQLNDLLGTSTDHQYRLIDDPNPPQPIASSADESLRLPFSNGPI